MTDLAETRHKLAERFTTPAARILSKTGVTPNMLTVMGFLVSIAAAVLIAKEYFLAGGLVVLFAGAFDLLDGPVARVTGKTTKFGGFLDSTLDRLSEAAVLAGILAYYAFFERRDLGTSAGIRLFRRLGHGQLPEGQGGGAGNQVRGGDIHQSRAGCRYVNRAHGRAVVSIWPSRSCWAS